jgi:hypothetical protein
MINDGMFYCDCAAHVEHAHAGCWWDVCTCCLHAVPGSACGLRVSIGPVTLSNHPAPARECRPSQT